MQLCPIADATNLHAELGALRSACDDLRSRIGFVDPSTRARFATLQAQLLDLENRVAFLASSPPSRANDALESSTRKLALEIHQTISSLRRLL